MTQATRTGVADGHGVPDEGGPAQRIGLGFLLAFLFLGYSRLTDEWVREIVGVSADGLWVVFIVSTGALVCAVRTGGARDAMGGLIGKLLLGFTCWLLLATPFSYWRGGSLDMLRYQWGKSFFVFIIVAGLLRTRSETQRAMVTIGRAVLLAALACLLLGVRSAEGRLAVSQGTLSGPNDVAQLLLIGLPFCWLSTKATRPSTFGRPLAIGSTALIVGAVLATGSRSGFVAIGTLLLAILLLVSFNRKIKVLLGAAVLLAVGSVLLPDEAWIRYRTIWGSRAPGWNWQEQSAVDSADERREILKQSLRLTLTHPLVGVGPGVFQAASAVDSNRGGQRALWRETHNTYTQISSEAGIPALLLYLAVLGICLRRNHNAWRVGMGGERPEALMALCLYLSLISFAVTAMFSSVAYQYYFPTLAGLTVAIANDRRARATPGASSKWNCPAPHAHGSLMPAAETPPGFRPRPAAMSGISTRSLSQDR